MKLQYFICFICIVQLCGAPPVSQKKENHEEDSQVNNLEDYMEYGRYLKEVVNALESDPEFRAKLEHASEDDIRSGKIAEHLEFVSHHVRTRLDEIKRLELDRLKKLVEQKRKLEDTNAIDLEDPMHHHVDHSNPHTFEIDDLKKLIAKTTADLAEADRKRKEEFKHYELEKEYQKREKLNHTNGEEREKLEKQYKEMEEKHKKHEKLHEPGHKAQLEEVWEEQDQMQQDFDPKTFFMLHDLDGNGLWDQDEVKALFVTELNKMYNEASPEDDMREKYEEMERMRESVFNEMDKNNDGFIDFDEFLRQTNSNDFKQDHGWQALDEQKAFSDEELAEYIRQHELQQIPPGVYQAPSDGYPHAPPSNYQQGGYQQHPQVPPGGYQQQGGYQQHPQVPPGGYQQQQQVPPGGYQQQQVPPGGYQQQQVPPGGYQQQQVPPVGHQQQQVPPGGYQQQQVPPGGYQQQQVPPGGYQQQQHHQGNNPQAPQGGHQQGGSDGSAHQQQGIPQGGNQQAPVPPQGQVNQQQQQQQGVPQKDLNTNEVNPGHAQQQINRNALH
ncbi:unnamed protein product [Phyllotreta striolata]|uniref:Nucleobindin-2 n=1 Tax=Phyllotreta striolata TaxID=444603 RepID=A0A9N9TSU4_PHYSR|nr:unnamed protein product [Phyllotreta striolata]